MTHRTLGFAVTRPRVFVPGLLGLWLLVGHLSFFLGVGLAGIALWQLLRIAGNPELEVLLRLRQEKRRHRITRLLLPAEREEILTLDRYVERLGTAGADVALGQEIMARAWEALRNAGSQDASAELRLLRHSLPPLGESAPAGASPLAARVNRELNLLRATRLEVDHLEAMGRIEVEHDAA